MPQNFMSMSTSFGPRARRLIHCGLKSQALEAVAMHRARVAPASATGAVLIDATASKHRNVVGRVGHSDVRTIPVEVPHHFIVIFL